MSQRAGERAPSGMRIMIADDNEHIHGDFQKVLSGQPTEALSEVERVLFGEEEDQAAQPSGPDVAYRIDSAFQGEEAIALAARAEAENDPYALIFMDVRMPPGMDGIRATAEIWATHPEIEIVICTAHSDYSWRQMLGELGKSDKLQFIRKPFDMVSVQQLALALTTKWQLGRQTRGFIERLQVEIDHKEEAQRQLAALNEDLETRIRDRTRELEAANRELTQALDALHQAKDRLVVSEKMAALGSLVAGVAHEINTPVGVGVTAGSHLRQQTLTMVSLFQSGAMKRSDLERYLAVAEESASIILTNLERASSLIHGFKQVAVDQSSEERRVIKVVPYLKEVLLSLRPSLKHTRHRIEVSGNESLELDTFPGALSQVITNLVLNSVTHAYADGDAGLLDLHYRVNGGEAILTFRDDGKGIAEELAARVFEPFVTTRRGRGGSGLGLSIVYNLVTRTLGGHIACKSKPGEGTVFEMNLPLEKH